MIHEIINSTLLKLKRNAKKNDAKVGQVTPLEKILGKHIYLSA